MTSYIDAPTKGLNAVVPASGDALPLNRPRILSIQSRCIGHTTYARNMERMLADSDRSQIDFHFMDEERELPTRVLNRLGELRIPGAWIRRQNLDLHRYRAEKSYGRMARRLIERKLLQHPYDVVHIQTQVGGYDAARLARHIPFVVTADITAVQVSQESTLPEYRWTYLPNIAVERELFAQCARCVFWSQWSRDSYVRDLGGDPAKSCVIPPGTDVAAFPEWNRDRREETKRLPRILFVGGDFIRKGGQDLVTVFQERLAGKAILDLVTSSPLASDAQGVRVHRGVQAFTPEWMSLYEQADIFALPSYFEGMPSSLVEAAAATLPIVATNINGIPEVVANGTNGLTLAPGDCAALANALETLVADPALRLRMGRAGRIAAETKLNSALNFRRLEQVFLDVAAGSDAGSGKGVSIGREGN